MLADPTTASAGLDAVLTTDELARRSPRPPDHAAEARALVDLARTMAETPRRLLQRLSELAMELCGADSAGISILETDGAGDRFRWHAIAGRLAPNVWGTIARHACPCGEVIARNEPLLFAAPERHYPGAAAGPPVVEALLVPFHVGGRAVGTLWVIAHTPDRRFDAEDARLLTSLSRLAAAGWQTVTALDAAEEARDRSEAEGFRSREALRAILDTIPQRVFWKANDLTYLGCNRPFARDMGYDSPEEVVGKSDYQGAWLELADQFRADDRRVIDSGVPKLDYEEVVVAADGSRRWVRTSKQPLRGPDGAVVGVLGTYEDVTERRRIEQQLRDQEELLREAATLAHVGGWSFDPATLKGEWTAETARIYGADPAARPDVASCLRHYDPADRSRLEEALRRAIADGTPYDLELRFTAATGVRKWVRSMGRPVYEGGQLVRVRGSIQDVTERRTLEEKLRQSQKMDAFGQLAGGVAHDFNNMLQVINGYADLLAEGLPPGDERAGVVAEIRKAGERSAALTSQLLAFARQQVAAPRLVDVGAAAADTAGMLRPLIGEDVRLVTDLPRGGWPVFVDPGQLEQVLLNLAVNARDAMPAGGTLTVAARSEAVGPAEAALADMKAGEYTVLSVTDTGCGMPADVQARVFEPFFTTKGVGKGTGLGLATVYGIVSQAGGHVRVRSRVGEGSTFDVYLPRASGAGPGDSARPGVRSLPRGSETVLVVEDEAAVRGLVKAVLSGRGYTVLEAGDGATAEQVAAGFAGPIHLVLSDVVMPGVGGRAAAAGVLATHPEAKVMFISGYTDDAVMRRGVSSADVPFLQKPFTPALLATRVRQVLDAAGDGGRVLV
ncbi:Blue-light-activated protein [Gemmata obscuriglobus]|uniref:histidine kinase n=1 Tax=Gemmata obscuriglobus TaxID=114 RepID=A0A2Z3H9K3_9BACT|nr:PAS domain S-box protein [Gemmata obscuriglobus]AWM40217.1 PAS domain S-box protein [Gemmata obscuriglobus]QEG26593.1 Blue-light-activated protein [Gemmata obscuriglobus]VTS02068.1 multi-sensor hybrid histidine kinase : Multi-sensor hybrid histidine kinase OS=Desulfatibacillum alkenivorans (strain AK-01) GN=Dalk_3402 PE=4 SV=1: GAF_2: PAS_4: PAS_3: HisKA: HATPase_c: Response_reg [Gemmata obscuriglobus UQM 2246]